MDIKEFYLNRESYFNPRTPNAAIRGIKQGLLPKESYISSSLFLYSPFNTTRDDMILSDKEELQRIQELERILAKKELSIEMEIQLITTLDRLVDHKNSEIALFAAESINSLESRYNKIIYELKESITLEDLKIDRITLIKTLYKYGVINQEKTDIKEYYFHELLEIIDDRVKEDIDIIRILISVLEDLKMFQEASELLKSIKSEILDQCELKKMEMSLAFSKGDFNSIFTIIERCESDELPEYCREELTFWKE